MVMVIQTAMGIPIDNGPKNTSQWIDECPEDRQFAQVCPSYDGIQRERCYASRHPLPKGVHGSGSVLMNFEEPINNPLPS